MKEMNEKPLNKVTRRGGTAHTNLDHLAGTWSAEEAKAFARRTAAFEMVDERALEVVTGAGAPASGYREIARCLFQARAKASSSVIKSAPSSAVSQR